VPGQGLRLRVKHWPIVMLTLKYWLDLDRFLVGMVIRFLWGVTGCCIGYSHSLWILEEESRVRWCCAVSFRTLLTPKALADSGCSNWRKPWRGSGWCSGCYDRCPLEWASLKDYSMMRRQSVYFGCTRTGASRRFALTAYVPSPKH